MQRTRLPVFVVLAVAALVVAGCAKGAGEAAHLERVVQVEPIEGTDLRSVTLTEQSAGRLGIQTTKVEPGQAGETVVPYSAVLYDEHGGTWVYTNPNGLTFVRASITVDNIDGDVARLSDGPPTGTVIATVGISELFGAEMGVGSPE
jgi:hypothetical protein